MTAILIIYVSSFHPNYYAYKVFEIKGYEYEY